MKFNRHIILGRVRYNVFCDDPSYDLCFEGTIYLRSVGWHPEHNPWVDDATEEYLLNNYLLRCLSIPTVESGIDQLN